MPRSAGSGDRPVPGGTACHPGADEAEACLLVDAAGDIAIRPKGAGDAVLPAVCHKGVGQRPAQALAPVSGGDQQVEDATVATINGKAVKQSEYYKVREAYDSFQQFSSDVVADQSMQSVIYDSYLAPAFKQMGINVVQGEIDNYARMFGTFAVLTIIAIVAIVALHFAGVFTFDQLKEAIVDFGREIKNTLLA